MPMKMHRYNNKAQRRWVNLYNILSNKSGVEVVLTPPGILKGIFANAEEVKDNKAVVANFSSPRQGETEHYKNIKMNKDMIQ